MLGLLATNTIAQGDTREVGLEQLLEREYSILRAVQSQKWPGAANLEVAIVWLRKGQWEGDHNLEGRKVNGITAFLTALGEVSDKPFRLAENQDKSFIGSYVLGMGFVMSPKEAQALIDKNPKNKDVLFPFLNGQDLNSQSDQSARRWVINFFDWPLMRGVKGSWENADEKQRKNWLREGVVPDDYPHSVAADYPDCLTIVEEKVKPERTRKSETGEYQLRYPLYLRWWHYAEKRPKLYSTIAGKERVLVTAQTSRRWQPAFQPNGIVYSHTIVVFPLQDWGYFSIMQSVYHEEWRLKYGATLRQDARYTPSDCFETFPFPQLNESLSVVGKQYHRYRETISRSRKEGLTKISNRFHNPEESTEDIRQLRDLHVNINKTVAIAYGWEDLKLGHGFHETSQGLCFTIDPKVRSEVMTRLLKLNHERYQQEIEQKPFLEDF